MRCIYHYIISLYLSSLYIYHDYNTLVGADPRKGQQAVFSQQNEMLTLNIATHDFRYSEAALKVPSH